MDWKRVAIIVLALGIGACAQSGGEPVEVSGQARASIFGGAEEAGHSAVGALTTVIRGAYQGNFCTGTLIAPTWVLTASHCVDGQRRQLAEQGIRLDDDDIHFYIGTRAQSRRGSPPRSGELYQVRRVHFHPEYDPDANFGFYDIALLELADRVDDTPPYAIRRQGIDPIEGDQILYVGFGVNDGEERTGSGTKRSTSLRLESVLPAVYITAHGASGVCYGDSGGPGLVPAGGSFEVIGVNSTASGGDEACRDGSVQTRVDAFETWIDTIMGQPGCNGDADCPCAGVCGRDGVCDAPECGTPCADFAECASSCRQDDSRCFFRCTASASPTAHRTYEAASECARGCPQGDRACLQERCPEEMAACFVAADVGDDDCGEIWSCVNDCQAEGCQQTCYQGGTVAAQEVFYDLIDCIQTKCADRNTMAEYNACLAQRCGQALTACMPPDDCRVTGGDCPAGRACLPEAWGETYCQPTDGVATSAECDASRVSCEDGAFCTNLGAGALCQQVCLEDADCQVRNPPCQLFDDAPSPFGVCIGGVDCADGDADGTCDEEDCRPDNPVVHPGADEICGNMRDDDCDEIADEGCPDSPDPGAGGASGAGGTPGAGGMMLGAGGSPIPDGTGGQSAPGPEIRPVASDGLASQGCVCDLDPQERGDPWGALGLLGVVMWARRRRPSGEATANSL